MSTKDPFTASSLSKKRLVKDTIKRRKERRELERESLVDRNTHLEDRVRIIESGITGETEWYIGKTAHNMYLKQARSYTRNDISFKERNFRATKYPLEKYRGIQAQRICYFCGKNGHY